MQRPNNLRLGDRFRVIEGDEEFEVGEIITLKEDDGGSCPFFWAEDKSGFCDINFSKLEPHHKTIRDVQAGDVVVSSDGYERLVLERWQNTVVLSYPNNFKVANSTIYTFDELEEYYTLKDVPEIDDKTAEAMKVLEEAGYKIIKD